MEAFQSIHFPSWYLVRMQNNFLQSVTQIPASRAWSAVHVDTSGKVLLCLVPGLDTLVSPAVLHFH